VVAGLRGAGALMEQPRVLIFTARYRYEGPAIASVFELLKQTNVPCEWLQIDEQPYQNGNQNILHLLNIARQRMLAGNYTHLLVLEDDMVVPPDALDKLMACNAPVAYSLYCWRRTPHYWSAYRALMEDNGVSWSDDEPHTIAAKMRNEEIIEVAGVGLGCTLIDRATIEAVPWRLGESRASCDWYFAVDAQRAKIRQVAHLGVVCGHLSTSPSARIIWPDPEGLGKQLYRYEYYERPIVEAKP